MRTSRRAVLSMVLGFVMAAGCGSNVQEGEPVVREFFLAARDGDVVRQLSLVREEDRGDLGTLVLRQVFPYRDLRHFQLDSVVFLESRGDTAVWRAWGKEPNREQWKPPVADGGEIREPTAAELASLPLVTRRRELMLVREQGRWQVPLDAAAAGPALALRDSMSARCPYGADPRLCRPLASRLLQASGNLGVHRERLAFLAEISRDQLAEAAAMDSLVVEDISGGGRSFGDMGFADVDFTIRNRSSIPLEFVWYRILGAGGVVIQDLGLVRDLPAHGSKGGTYTWIGRPAPPYRVEITHVGVEEER